MNKRAVVLSIAFTTLGAACERASQDVLHLSTIDAGLDGAGAGTGGTSATDARVARVRPPGPPSLDVLFVVDDSGSMAQEQQALTAGFGAFIKELSVRPGGLPDLHVAVVSSDVGAGGVLIPGNPACNRPGGDRGRFDPFDRGAACGLSTKPTGLSSEVPRYLISLEHDSIRNFAGSIQDVFGCMAQLGTQGCGFEHQLESMRLALSFDRPVSSGSPADGGPAPSPGEGQSEFLRDWADLLVVIVTDEDDCSGPRDTDFYAAGTDAYPNQTSNARCAIDGHRCHGTNPPNGAPFSAPLASCDADPAPKHLFPVQRFVDAVLATKPTPEQVHVAVIAGQTREGTYELTPFQAPAGMSLIDLAPSCASSFGEAAPGLRLQAFAGAFGTRGKMFSICDDFATSLQAIARGIKDAI